MACKHIFIEVDKNKTVLYRAKTVVRGTFGENDEKLPPGNRAGQTDDYLGL